MTKRAPISAALPPRPDASIVLGEERYGEPEVFADILAYGRVVGPREEAEAAAAAGTTGRWEVAWRGAPLVIHDAGLVQAIGAIAPDLMDVSESVAMAAIGAVLEEHPGPVGSLRLESLCLSPHIVAGLMDRLRAKGEHCLRELVAVNTNRPKNEEDDHGQSKNGGIFFPLRVLPCGLKSLSLCLFDLRPLGFAGNHLTCLEELRLTGCYFSGKALSAMVSELCSLMTLVLTHCHLTSGATADGFSIVSCNLRRLGMWMCTASGEICVEYTPKLQALCIGVCPQNRDARLHIALRTPNALRELHGFMMRFHDLSYVTATNARLSYVTDTNAKIKGRRVAPLMNLSVLRVSIQMSTPFHMLELLKLLVHFPNLRHLTVTRVDSSQKDVEFTVGQEIFEALCITNTLQEVVLDQFRGGSTELKFLTHILATAAALSTIRLKPHATLSEMQVAHAYTVLADCPRASADCRIQVID